MTLLDAHPDATDRDALHDLGVPLLAMAAEPAVPAAAAEARAAQTLERFRDPLHIPRVVRPGRDGRLHLTSRRTRIRLHSQLPATTMWGYNGEVPGPTIEVRRDHLVTVAWENRTIGTMPLIGVAAPTFADAATVGGYRYPDGTLKPGFAMLEGLDEVEPWQVVHVHGALTNGWNDGWAANAVGFGDTQLSEYPNRQAATLLWYHDHAMDVTRFTVAAGLAGLWIIRDEEEDALALPSGRREVPLILRDVNLDTDPATEAFTGDQLYKIPRLGGVDIPFTGPFTLVNGRLWPHHRVDACWYRFRVLNAANSRFYQLSLRDEDGTVLDDAVRIIGTDGGLLPAPAPMPATGALLSPAERLDLLIDFSGLAGERVRLVDTRGPTPTEIMEFVVRRRPVRDHVTEPPRLADSYVRLTHGDTVPHEHEHVVIAMVPPGTQGNGHPEFWELAELHHPPHTLPAADVIQLTNADGTISTYHVIARSFHDTTSLFFNRDAWTVWHLINVGGPAHPVHIHMIEFQKLARRVLPRVNGVVVGFDPVIGGTTQPIPLPDPTPFPVHEEGWKDTFIVGPGEWVSVAGQFSGATGAFMYHCHILDHEDAGMMRPFCVRPASVGRFGHGGGHGSH